MSNDHVRLLAANLFTRRIVQLQASSAVEMLPNECDTIARRAVAQAEAFYTIFDEFRERRQLEGTSLAAASLGRYDG